MIYYAFDPEDPGIKNGWKAQGLLLGGNGDLGSKPVTLRVWSRVPSHIDEKSSSDLSHRKGVAIAVLVEDATEECPESCPKKRFEFSVTNDGKVFADGKLVGTIQ